MPTLLGIDTGGTYTDAVLFDSDSNDATGSVRRIAKALTTKHDLAIGVGEAIDGVLAGAEPRPDIRLVSLSTTLATNAIVEGQGSPVCLLMIGHGPDVLKRAGLDKALDGDPVVFLDGGHSHGGDEQATLDLDAARAAIAAHAPHVSAFAVAGYFAVRNPAHEQALRDLIHDMTGLPVSCGHELSWRLDAPRRALTAVLNARLIPLIHRLVHAVRSMLEMRGINAPLMVVKGDGSLVSAETALEKPVETILSGPAASVVGAHHLSGEQDVFVVDMGGTTTDIALLEGGRPVLAAEGATVGGWRTMVEAVAAHTFGLGGDSEVWFAADRAATLRLGPRRVTPLSLLASEHPQVLETLRAQAARGVCGEAAREVTGRFAMRLGPLDHGHGSLTAAEERLWHALADGPVALEKLFTADHSERALTRMVKRGLVTCAGFTPSDAAHLLGHHSQWSVEAAEIGAGLWARRVDMEAEAFARRVMEFTTLRAAEAVVTAALAEGGGPVAGDYIAYALDADADDHGKGGDRLLDVALSLGRPLVAIGAPAATYYPAVAARLHTRLVMPPHGAVCNAVGAVAGGVAQTATALITAPEESRYRVHITNGVQEFANLDVAAETAEREVRALAEAMAREAGAVEVRVEAVRKDVIAKGKDGLKVFIESQIVATALGRPRLGRARRGAAR
ncbi:MAG: hydantoinase/oxoprolinase family protein [Proteobacteria bacterium]|nr:hydantoinase/oxoprolinase family protein [Pseudomonadota bacterium]